MSRSLFLFLPSVALFALVFAGAVFADIATPAKRAPAACTMEAKLCPDGSSVSRAGPDCAFAPCPGDPGATVPPPPSTGKNVMPGGDIGDGMEEPGDQNSGVGSPPVSAPASPAPVPKPTP